jgi:homoserine dehydrogenase
MTKEKEDFEKVLNEAKIKGYAEPDPTNDIEGYDPAYKIAILASVGFRTKVDLNKVYREGITKITQKDIEYANELGYQVKLLAIAKNLNNKIELRVHPALILNEHPLASVSGVYNAILVKGNLVGDVMFYGKGAGDMPTASAVLGDVVEISQKIVKGIEDSGFYFYKNKKIISDIGEINTKYYLRMQVLDKPGVLAKIAGIFGKENVSIAQVVQKGSIKNVAEIAWVTHKVKERNFQSSLRKIKKLNVVKKINNLIRVEE